MLRLIDGNNRFRAKWEKLGPNALMIMYNESCQAIQNSTLIWVWDGVDGTAKRKETFPEYKGGKRPASDQFHETMTLFKQLLSHSNCLQLSVDGYEADDVIATLAKGSEQPVFIDSNDADFLALENERINVNRDPLPNCTPFYIQLFKTLVGDKSDNIKGLPGFGEGTWSKLEDSEKNLLINHFTNQNRLTGEDVKELLGWTKGLSAKWENNIALLDQYWQVTSFYDVPFELIKSNLTPGVLNAVAAQAMLGELLLTMDNEKEVPYAATA